ncbi:MAG: hypothetical protein HKN68_02400 [Saprospiraceae bacterium]|nr:hypothetical protein [Saprospiraceae bacterium]
MKIISLILAINLLTSSLHVCFSNVASYHASELISNQSDTTTQSCCKSGNSEDSSQEEKSSCKDGCACCFTTTVVIIDAEIPSDFNPEVIPQLENWVTENYTHDFTHLIWHPPQVA